MGLQSNFEWSKATFILCSCVFQLFRKYRYLLRSGTANNAETYSSVTFYTRPLPTFTVHTKNRERKKIWEFPLEKKYYVQRKSYSLIFSSLFLLDFKDNSAVSQQVSGTS